MDRRKLPSAAISTIGQGATRLGTRASHDRARVEARIAAMRHGIARGLSYIDTAPLYGAGFSEEVVGEALVGLRKRCFLATKIGLDDDSSHAGIRQSIRDSMARLGTDYLDLVQVPWPLCTRRKSSARWRPLSSRARCGLSESATIARARYGKPSAA